MTVRSEGFTRRVFVDQDGVLANFTGHFEALHGSGLSRGMPDPSGMWETIEQANTFFLDLPVLSDARDLWLGLKALGLNPAVLSGLSHPVTDGVEQKRAWMAREIDDEAEVIVCLSRDKWKHCRPGDILIDDWRRYEGDWVAAGGVFVHHVSAVESLAEVAKVLDMEVVR